jgi:hypothetical protein
VRRAPSRRMPGALHPGTIWIGGIIALEGAACPPGLVQREQISGQSTRLAQANGRRTLALSSLATPGEACVHQRSSQRSSRRWPLIRFIPLSRYPAPAPQRHSAGKCPSSPWPMRCGCGSRERSAPGNTGSTRKSECPGCDNREDLQGNAQCSPPDGPTSLRRGRISRTSRPGSRKRGLEKRS